jgi:hypothetical protein
MDNGDPFDSHVESNLHSVMEQFWKEWETEYNKFLSPVRKQWKKEET